MACLMLNHVTYMQPKATIPMNSSIVAEKTKTTNNKRKVETVGTFTSIVN